MGPFEQMVETVSAGGSETLQETPWGLAHVRESLTEAAATLAIPTGRMSGELKLSRSSGWALLNVPNSFVRGVFDAMDEEGVELPVSKQFGPGTLNAHISVMNDEEVKQAGGANVIRANDGRTFRYQLGPMKVVTPAKAREWKRIWYITVKSPELEDFRKAHGLSARPNNNKFDFHITVAVLPKK